MNALTLTGARVFDGRCLAPRSLHVLDGRIAAIAPPGTGGLRLPGGILMPGFVDLQVNGGGGVLLNDAPSVETLRRIVAAQARLGATTCLPTLITDTADKTRQAIAAVREAAAQGLPGLAGLHLEGPHLSVARKGAHAADLIRPMSEDDLQALEAAARALPVLKVTLAPEIVSPAQIERLVRAGALVSLGHSDCSLNQARAAAEAGARCVTHLFNAMSPLGHRAPGLVGATLEDGRLSAGLIADGIHVDLLAMRAALSAKRGPGQVFLVSDAMAVAGTDADRFTLNGRTILRCDGRLTLEDGTLAGADLDLARAIRCLVTEAGVALTRALAMATAIPGALIGRGGHLRPGAPAHVVWLRDDLTLGAVWQNGRAILSPDL